VSRQRDEAARRAGGDRGKEIEGEKEALRRVQSEKE